MKRTFSMFLLLCAIALSCTQSPNHSAQAEKMQVLVDSLKNVLTLNEASMKPQIFTFLTFQKEDAEQAMNLYVELFDNSEIVDIKRWGKDAPSKEGTIMQATFNLNGNMFMCSDSPPVHEWDFSPAVSNFVVCKDEEEQKRLFDKLSENGKVMMPLGNYGFSKQFGWVEDMFGVSWQLNVE